jgi:hypothetical protein
VHDSYTLAQWKEQYPKLENRSISCPSCGAINPVIPMQADGMVVDREHSSETRHFSIIGRYPLFFPAVYGVTDTGYVLMSCRRCAIQILAVVPKEGYLPTKAVWPLPDTQVSTDVPEPVRSAVVDAKLAHAAGSKTGAIMSARTCVERVQRRESAKSLTELWETKGLPKSLFDTANEPRLWGHVVAHDDFDPESVTDEQVKDLLSFLDVFLDMLYVTPAKLERARSSRREIKGS